MSNSLIGMLNLCVNYEVPFQPLVPFGSSMQCTKLDDFIDEILNYIQINTPTNSTFLTDKSVSPSNDEVAGPILD